MNCWLRVLAWLAISLSLTFVARAAESDDRRVEKLVGELTLEEKLDYIGGINAMSIRPVLRLGLPEIRMSDGPLGVRQDKPSTRYPAGIALAASWNRDLAQWEGVSIARDCRARGIHVLLAPGVNINRLPICGRNFEYLSGEDPYLASELVVRLVVIAIDGRLFEGAVHPLDLAVIRHDGCRRFHTLPIVGDMVRPSGLWGAGST